MKKKHENAASERFLQRSMYDYFCDGVLVACCFNLDQDFTIGLSNGSDWFESLCVGLREGDSDLSCQFQTGVVELQQFVLIFSIRRI